MTEPPRISVVVVTWRRPDAVRACLEHLAVNASELHEVLVVDASDNQETARVVDDFVGVRHLRFPRGAGHMTSSRNAALLEVTGDIVAFIDDDANVQPGWAAALREAFADEHVGAVAGRTLNGHPGEESDGVDAIGRLNEDGSLSANFAANPGRIVPVQHGIGANMAFRSDVLRELGGFRDDFRGVGGVREDTDVFLRVGALGYRSVFSPTALAQHVGAPHVRGRRFDLRYTFWLEHNHTLLLARNFGLGSPIFRRSLRTRVARAPKRWPGRPARRIAHASAALAGVGVGLLSAAAKGRWSAVSPVRTDRAGLRTTEKLAAPSK